MQKSDDVQKQIEEIYEEALTPKEKMKIYPILGFMLVWFLAPSIAIMTPTQTVGIIILCIGGLAAVSFLVSLFLLHNKLMLFINQRTMSGIKYLCILPFEQMGFIMRFLIKNRIYFFMIFITGILLFQSRQGVVPLAWEIIVARFVIAGCIVSLAMQAIIFLRSTVYINQNNNSMDLEKIEAYRHYQKYITGAYAIAIIAMLIVLHRFLFLAIS